MWRAPEAFWTSIAVALQPPFWCSDARLAFSDQRPPLFTVKAESRGILIDYAKEMVIKFKPKAHARMVMACIWKWPDLTSRAHV